MGRLGSRIRKLEDPRSHRDREKAREIAQKAQEMEERAQRWFETIAEAHPERVDDFLEAVGELRRAMQQGTPEPRVAARTYAKARQRFEHGSVGGIECEDCGREGERPSGSYEGTCGYCGGVTSWEGYREKNIISLEKLEASITASRNGGYEELAQRLEGLMERRLLNENGANERSSES